MAERLHRITGLLILFFIVSHLAVHLTALISVDAHLTTLKIVQQSYRNQVIEPLLIIALFTQVGLGLKLGWARWRSTRGLTFEKLQLVSGFYLAFFILNHTGSAFLTRYGFDLETNFYWASGTLNHSILRWFFYPYYALAILATFAHVAAAIRYHAKSEIGARVTLLLGVIVSALILGAFGGWLYPITIPQQYLIYYDTLLELGPVVL